MAPSYPTPTPTLITLPPELRLQILTHLLVRPTPLSRITRIVPISRTGPTTRQNSFDTTRWRFEAGGSLGLHVSILRASRQLYAESYALLYEHNTLLVAIARQKGDTPIDILGHWRATDCIEPARKDSSCPRGKVPVPDITRFVRFEFLVYCDLSPPTVGPLIDEPDLVQLIVAIRARELKKLTVLAYEGSVDGRFSRAGSEARWKGMLEVFLLLSCWEVLVLGDVPEETCVWLEEGIAGIREGGRTVLDGRVRELRGGEGVGSLVI